MYYYCSHCCVVSKNDEPCHECGKNDKNPIEINVQYHKQPEESN